MVPWYDTIKTLPPQYSTTTHRATSKKHRHHDLPHPPASSGFNFTGECNRRTLRNRYQSPQHGNAIFLCQTNFFFILLTIILCAADRCARGQKVCFLVNTCAFYSAVASNQHALTPSIRRYIFCRCLPRPHHVLA